MLDRNVLIRWWSALLGCALALSWAACESTETGNPPVVTESFLQHEAVDEGLLVIGQPGAVLPGGSWIEITDLATGLSESVKTEKDGSFRLLIVGGKGPVFTFRAWNRSGSGEVVTTSSGPGADPAEAEDARGEAPSIDGAAATPSPEAGADEPPPDAGSAQPQVDAGAVLASDAGVAPATDAAVTAEPSEGGADAAQPEELSGPCPNEGCSGPLVISVTRDQ